MVKDLNIYIYISKGYLKSQTFLQWEPVIQASLSGDVIQSEAENLWKILSEIGHFLLLAAEILCYIKLL